MLNRFHYSVDIILAVLLTLLCYTNVGVALVVNAWAEWTRRAEQHKHQDMFGGVLWIPPFFFPFCCLRSRYLVHASTTQEYLQFQEDVYAAHVEKCGNTGGFASAQVRPDQDVGDGSVVVSGAAAAADENKMDLGEAKGAPNTDASKYAVPEASDVAVPVGAAAPAAGSKSTSL